MNNAYPCPACGASANLGSGCTGCGRPPHATAAEVIRLDREIVVLGGEAERARQAYEGLTGRLTVVRRRRAELAAAVRAEFPAGPVAGRPGVPAAAPTASAPWIAPRALIPGGAIPGGAGAGGPVPGAGGTPVPAMAAADAGGPGGAETSTKTVQNLLFVLGGLLLGTAATVFTAVAWASVGVSGRALILLAITALMLAVPFVARWRKLHSTAETFAAVGLLLVVLDGYAAWTVDLFGVSGWPSSRYAGLVALVATGVSAGYALISRLTVPWFAALLAVQPVVPLLVAEARPGLAGWTVAFVGVALVDLAVVAALRHRTVAGEGATTNPGQRFAGQFAAWVGYAVAVLAAAGCALVPLLMGEAGGSSLLAGAPMLLVALTMLGAALLAGGPTWRALAAAFLVPALAAAVLRPAAEVQPSVSLLAAGLVAVALVGVVRLLPVSWRPGPRAGTMLVVAGVGLLLTLTTLVMAAIAVGRSVPAWRGATAGPTFDGGWQVSAAVALVAVAVGWLLPRAARPAVAAVGVGLATLAVPLAWAAPWLALVVLDLPVGAALVLSAVARPAVRGVVSAAAALTGLTLLGHGLLVGLAAPGGAGAACAVIVVVGVGAAALGRRGDAVQRVVAGCGAALAVLVTPVGAAIALIGVGAPPWWQARAALAALALPVVALLAVRRLWPDLHGYASTGLAVAAVLTGLAPLTVPADERLTVYAAVGALLLAVSVARSRPPVPALVAGVGLAVATVLAAVPVTVIALVTPYGPPPAPWSGVPSTVAAPGALPVGVALTVLALAAALVTWPADRAGRGRMVAVLLPFVAAAGPVLLVAAAAPWPVVPATALLGGVALLLVTALRGPSGALLGAGLPVGLVLTGAGLLNLQATHAGTLAGLGLLVVAATVVGAAARAVAVRPVGWLVAVASATGLAITAPLAGGLPLRVAAFAVLGVAVLVLVLAVALSGVRLVLDVTAQAVALVAVLLTVGSGRYAATICVLWGTAVGVRLLRRGESTGRRWVFAAIAGGSQLLAVWLLLRSGGVTVLEAYTVPVAVLALVFGAVAMRTRPGLRSWLALGPGLVALLLPSLVALLADADEQPWRRLLLGVAALAVTLVGAVRRWQAPVVLGGLTLARLALHEVGRSWDLLPRWVFLAVAGLALIGLAATYERRRRDLGRLRDAMGRMG
ncbi:SCO7613 C-terminal domain-containing membrane protein [Micromonospora craniellae]|uniref:Uncharacterized protein n=1 Tax=Micromonospora craniellae TaxID=2294034 RepID=A0A372G527_9ACTN|nr:hypothetical protein [Micromonospora craniellae]QOC90522.1 hypothetical protein ID554_20440 [Micromonospora craniellae]RFS48092.1 hypothetical protein D0Q02_00915 [Micromonospora craniellae]